MDRPNFPSDSEEDFAQVIQQPNMSCHQREKNNLYDRSLQNNPTQTQMNQYGKPIQYLVPPMGSPQRLNTHANAHNMSRI